MRNIVLMVVMNLVFIYLGEECLVISYSVTDLTFWSFRAIFGCVFDSQFLWIFVLLCLFWLVYNDFIDGANVEWISLQNLRHLMFMLFGKIIHYHVHLLFLSVESFMINQFKTPTIYIWFIITHCFDILEHFYWRFFYKTADSIHLTGLRTKC